MPNSGPELNCPGRQPCGLGGYSKGDVAGYGRLSYQEREQEHPRSQDVAEACAFLGADGLRAPNARDSTQSSLIVFCEQPTVVDKRVVKKHGPVDLSAE